MLLETLITILQDDYGVTAVDDDGLTTLINKVTKRISKYYPQLEISYVLAVKDQNRYTVSPANLIRVKEVFYHQGSSSLSIVFGDPNIPISNAIPYSTFQASQTMEFIQRLELMQKLNPTGADIVSHDKFDVVPAPTNNTDRIYYEYERFRTLAEIPEAFEDVFIEYVFFFMGNKKAMDTLSAPNANKYNFDRKGNQTGNPETAPKVMFNLRAEQEKDLIKKIKFEASKLK